ncbi:hypothetical protein I7I51_04250 [Histoplasma capsulatum]|uniref:Uncharacterized protein n=1 Tax=Ajellomyces capsulatus TaxID=5037 RepID=A0A8A1MBH8_AJECA|nr:hypothetical protein I7I51_04250 [Histoplasma capsulatum]
MLVSMAGIVPLQHGMMLYTETEDVHRHSIVEALFALSRSTIDECCSKKKPKHGRERTALEPRRSNYELRNAKFSPSRAKKARCRYTCVKAAEDIRPLGQKSSITNQRRGGIEGTNHPIQSPNRRRSPGHDRRQGVAAGICLEEKCIHKDDGVECFGICDDLYAVGANGWKIVLSNRAIKSPSMGFRHKEDRRGTPGRAKGGG